jgi:ABC-type glutathione transport system ATPase component
MGVPLLEVSNLVQEFPARDRGGVRSGIVHAVTDVSFTISEGEALGLVGETGSGKSTLARSVLQAPRPKSGAVRLRGVDLVGLSGRRLARERRHIQMVFQDPFGSLDPKWRVSQLVEEPLIAFATGASAERRRRVSELLDLVGLDPGRYGSRRPRELSGGQRR